MPKSSGFELVLIREVARATGLHQQTIRLYERRGLILPRRSAGGTRLFDAADIARLRRIRELGALNHLAVVGLFLELERELERLRAAPSA